MLGHIERFLGVTLCTLLRRLHGRLAFPSMRGRIQRFLALAGMALAIRHVSASGVGVTLGALDLALTGVGREPFAVVSIG